MIREMKCICVINQEKNFTKAAERLMISQPALSATVRKVEEEIGLPIFDRSTKPISLTIAGEQYIKSAEQILGIVNNMYNYFDNLKNLKVGEVHIGGSAFFCCFIFPELIMHFHKLYPGIDISITEGNVSQLQKDLIDETIDLHICTENESHQTGADSTLWKEEKLLLAVPASFSINHSLYEKRLTDKDILAGVHFKPDCPKVSVSQFKNEAFITLPKGNDIYNRTIAICKDSGFTPNIYMTPEQQLTAYYMVRSQMGISIIREQLLKYVDSSNDVFFYCIDSPLVNRDIRISYKKNRELPFAVTEFLKYIKMH